MNKMDTLEIARVNLKTETFIYYWRDNTPSGV